MEGAPVAAVLGFDLVLLLIVLFGGGTKGNRGQSALVAALFFCSGFPALIYQIVWQRSLFSIYGVNVQSVAVVVSAFMLGLGIGSLLGGKLSEKFPDRGILIFGICELLVAGFGLISLRLFHWAAGFTAGSSLGYTILFSFLLLIVPTMLMGATLPLLVEQLVRTSRNVGYSVATLYFVNTLGSAVACFVCAQMLLRNFGQSGSVTLAACVNTLVGATAFLYARGRRTQSDATESTPIAAEPGSQSVLGLGTAALIAGLAGFLALGFEIAWFRIFALATFDRAPAFAFLLSTYLAGIAAGSFLSETLVRKRGINPVTLAGFAMLLAGAISIYLPPLPGLFILAQPTHSGECPGILHCCRFAWFGSALVVPILDCRQRLSRSQRQPDLSREHPRINARQPGHWIRPHGSFRHAGDLHPACGCHGADRFRGTPISARPLSVPRQNCVGACRVSHCSDRPRVLRIPQSLWDYDFRC